MFQQNHNLRNYINITSDPYNALVIDNHPKMDRDKRLTKKFNVVLPHGSQHIGVRADINIF